MSVVSFDLTLKPPNYPDWWPRSGAGGDQISTTSRLSNFSDIFIPLPTPPDVFDRFARGFHRRFNVRLLFYFMKTHSYFIGP